MTIDKPGLAARWRADGFGGGARRSGSVITIGAHGIFSRAGADPVILEGTYHETMLTVSMQGGGYTIEAHRVFWDDTGSTGLVGGVTGPNGDGNIYCFDSRSDSVRVYAGTFDNALHSFDGKWNFATIDTVLIGLTWPNGSPAVGPLFRGSIERTGDTRAIFVDDRDGQNVIGASGTLDVASGAAAGTWAVRPQYGSADSGIWSATLVP